MQGLLQVSTPNGHPMIMAVRLDTVDHLTVDAITNHDEYGIRGRRWDGWALDVGAHIGTLACALALENPGLSVIAIEPVPENAALIRENVGLNGLGVHVIEAGASDTDGTGSVNYDFHSDGDDAEFVHHNRFIGGLFRTHPHMGREVEVETVSLAGVMARFGIERIALLKTDCEGGEWRFLSDPAANARVDEFVGEFHDRPWPAIADLLAATHDTTLLEDKGGHGLFRAVRRSHAGDRP